MASFPETWYSLSELIRFYADYGEGGHEFGPLHIALSDGNLSDADVHSCYEFAEEAGDTMALFIAVSLRGISEDEREALRTQFWDEYRSS